MKKKRLDMIGNTLRKGKPHTPETRFKMSEAQRRIQQTPEWREKMRIALLGKNKGKRPSGEARLKMSVAHKGKKATPETRAKMRASQRRGQSNNMWKGGITPLVRRVRTCFESRQWRSDVFSRDDFTCQQCGKRGGDLEAHHIKPFSQIFKENRISSLDEARACQELWNLNNGETLCIKCHNKTKRKL